MNQPILKKYFSIDGVLYFVLFILIIIFRYFVLEEFSFKYTDSDQSIMWLGLKNYSEGLFYEPRFYGQSYNTMLEAFFAVPLFKLGVPAYKILPIITSVFSLAPYFIISLFVFFKKSPTIALLILSIPLLLPIDYSLITSLSRGFVTGIFISSFGAIAIFFPRSRISFLFCSFITIVGFSVNSNSILIALPCLLFLFFENSKNIFFYIYSAIGIALGISIYFGVDHFYALNPFYDLHKFPFYYSFDELKASLSHLDIFFNGISPIFWHTGFIVLLLFAVIAVVLYKQKKIKETFIVLLVPIAIIITLGVNKVHDGNNSIFFSITRMYLSIPILICISLSFLDNLIYSRLLYVYLIIPCAYFTYGIKNLDKTIDKDVSPKINHVVAIMEVKRLYKECNYLKTISDKYNIQLIVISNHYFYDFYDYGCPSCIDKFPNTLRPIYERRTWRLVEDEKKVYSNILIIDTDRDFENQYKFVKRIGDANEFFLIENNKMFTMDLLDKLKIEYRKYK